jgi:hypothetical protein
MKIEELVEQVKQGKLVLPEIQRDFVWSLQKIADLWDSIYRGYPIGQLLFWRTDKQIPSYSFFNADVLTADNIADKLVFVAKKPQWHHDHTTDNAGRTIVLDGQQRITSLYLGLSEHGIKVQPQRNSRAHKIHLMKLGIFVGEQDEHVSDESQEKQPTFAWKPIEEDPESEAYGKIKDTNYVSLVEALSGRRRVEQIQELKRRLRGSKAVMVPMTDLSGMKMEDVLEVFQRLNNGGQKMSKSELFLAMWFGEEKAENLRQQVNEMRDLFGDFNVRDDTITRILAVVFGERSENLAKNEYSPDMFPRIQKGLPGLKRAVEASIEFLNQECFIYADSEMLSHSLFAPIVHTFYSAPAMTDRSKAFLRSFVYRALILGLFDRSTTTTLARLKHFVNQTGGDWSRLDEMHDEIKDEIFGERFKDKAWLYDQIEDLLRLTKGVRTNLILLLLRQEKANVTAGEDYYDQDHLVASNLFEQQADDINNGWHRYGQTAGGSKRLSDKEAKVWDRNRGKWAKLRDSLPNLWLLNDSMNRSKGKELLDLWYLSPNRTAAERADFWRESLLDSKKGAEYLKITNFENIYNDRKDELRNSLERLLKLPE